MSDVRLVVKYELGHELPETWRCETLHCPRCGAKTVWVETSGGDYYEGPQHICEGCGWTWTMPRLGEASGWQDEQRLEAIRTRCAS